MAINPQTAALSQVDRVSLPVHSMFSATPVYRLDDAASTVVFGLRQPVIQPANGDVSLQVSEPVEHRLDLIAQQFYGRPSGWWAIADASGLIDPLAGVSAGTVLRAPDPSRLPA